MEWPECVLCMDRAVLPVEFICFHEQPESAGTMIRSRSSAKHADAVCKGDRFHVSCYECARSYLSQDRDMVKCLFCRTPMKSVYRWSSIKECVRPNLALMGMHTNMTACIYSECPFRGYQKDVWNHLFDDKCLYAKFDCDKCGEMDVQKHSHSEENCAGYEPCFTCSKRVLKVEMAKHIRIEHEKFFCSWCHCYISKDTFRQHRSEDCCNRHLLVHCTECPETVRIQDMQRHLRSHLRYVEKLMEMQQLPCEWEIMSKKRITNGSLSLRIQLLSENIKSCVYFVRQEKKRIERNMEETAWDVPSSVSLNDTRRRIEDTFLLVD